MKIDRLILQGFKSFGDRTSLDFGPGVYGIVGPNGSGKSNLVEALRWAVGARARDLRGEEAQSLLFHGADGKAPLGFAEVALEIAGRERRFQVTRRLDKDGDSEVRLSGSRASLKQVEHALAGTGLSRGGYAVVGQGEVGQILQAGPEVLLAYLEEAAGLRTVAQAAKLTRERLEAAQAEWQTRAADLAERQGSIAQKARQAEAARQAAQLAARTLVLRRSVLASRVREADQERLAAAAKAAALEAERAQVAERLKALEGEKPGAQEALEAAQNANTEALRRAEALGGDLKLAEQERGSAESLLRRLAQDLADSEHRLSRLRSTPEPAPPAEPEPDPAALSDSDARFKALDGEIRAEEAAIRQGQQAFERYLQARATFEAQQASYQAALAQRTALEADQARLEAELSALALDLSRAEGRSAELRARLDELVKQEGALASEARAAASEHQRLEALLRSGSDLAEGPKRARDSGVPGVVGVVADLLEVPAGLELAVEIALGGRAQWVLTESEGAAQRSIEHLKQVGGRATFLSKTLLRPQGRRRDFSGEPGVVGLAQTLVRLPACPEALPTLLGETLVVQDLDSALKLSRRPDAPRMVTLEGELLETSGAITGGRVQKGGQMLALRRRRQEARQDADRLGAEAQALQAQTQALRGELQALALDALRRRQTELQSELKAAQGNLARQAKLAAPEAPQPVEAPSPNRLEALRAERDGLSQALGRSRELAAQWRRFREDQARYAEAQAQASDLENRLHALRTEQAELGQKLGAAQARRAELEAARAALNLAGLEAALGAARSRARLLADEETRLFARANSLLADLESSHLTQARREATIETLQQELSELPPGPAEEGGSRTLARLLSEAESALEALGPVNHLAEQEYALLSEDIAKLETALTESLEVVERLGAEVAGVEGEYRERLDARFAVFRERFSQYAEALLGAEVRLERVPGGLELVLRPAGKRTVHLDLLSMGERTMGALAFLFALAEVGEGGGLPIAVLDEVDAPLDEANIQRFCQFLRRFRGQTQFILVTHQKRTMEACDALYGVTTDRGVSRVYSIKRDEAMA